MGGGGGGGLKHGGRPPGAVAEKRKVNQTYSNVNVLEKLATIIYILLVYFGNEY